MVLTAYIHNRSPAPGRPSTLAGRHHTEEGIFVRRQQTLTRWQRDKDTRIESSHETFSLDTRCMPGQYGASCSGDQLPAFFADLPLPLLVAQVTSALHAVINRCLPAFNRACDMVRGDTGEEGVAKSAGN